MIAPAHAIAAPAAQVSPRPSRPRAPGSGSSPLLFALAGVGWWWTARPDAGHGRRAVDRPRDVRLVPRRLGRDDGRDDVPVGRADGRAVLPHDRGSARRCRRSLFAAGYLLTWAAAGAARVRDRAWPAARSPGDVLAWDRAGRWIAGATLVVAAVYELTPLKDVCLGKCRSPLGFLLGSWRDGRSGRAADGREERRLVRRLLLGADGVAVRARGS